MRLGEFSGDESDEVDSAGEFFSVPGEGVGTGGFVFILHVCGRVCDPECFRAETLLHERHE